MKNINKLDEKGECHGYWEINVGNYLWKGHYKNGKAYGVWKRLLVKNNLIDRRCLYVLGEINQSWGMSLDMTLMKDGGVNIISFNYYKESFEIRNLKHMEETYE